MNSEVIVVCDGGFIGGHVVADLLRSGFRSIRPVNSNPFDDWLLGTEHISNSDIVEPSNLADSELVMGTRDKMVQLAAGA